MYRFNAAGVSCQKLFQQQLAVHAFEASHDTRKMQATLFALLLGASTVIVVRKTCMDLLAIYQVHTYSSENKRLHFLGHILSLMHTFWFVSGTASITSVQGRLMCRSKCKVTLAL